MEVLNCTIPSLYVFKRCLEGGKMVGWFHGRQGGLLQKGAGTTRLWYWLPKELTGKTLPMGSATTLVGGISVMAITGLLWVTLQFPFSSLVESGLCSLGYACPSSVSAIAVVDENLMAILERPMHSLLFCSYFSPLLPCNSLCFLSLRPPKTSVSFAYACALSNVDWLPFAPNLKLLNNEPANMYLYLCT